MSNAELIEKLTATVEEYARIIREQALLIEQLEAGREMDSETAIGSETNIDWQDGIEQPSAILDKWFTTHRIASAMN